MSLALRLATAALLLATPAAAQISEREYAARRDTVAAHLGDAVLLAFGATSPMTDQADFTQLPSFAYLTGYTRMDAAFLMVVSGGRPTYQMLFEPPTDPRLALYNGFRPDSAAWRGARGWGCPSCRNCARNSSRPWGAGRCTS